MVFGGVRAFARTCREIASAGRSRRHHRTRDRRGLKGSGEEEVVVVEAAVGMGMGWDSRVVVDYVLQYDSELLEKNRAGREICQCP